MESASFCRIAAILPDDTDVSGLIAEVNRRFPEAFCYRSSARGIGRTTRRTRLQPLIAERRHLVSVITDAREAETIFEFVIETAQIKRYGGGLVYLERLGQGFYALASQPTVAGRD